MASFQEISLQSMQAAMDMAYNSAMAAMAGLSDGARCSVVIDGGRADPFGRYFATARVVVTDIKGEKKSVYTLSDAEREEEGKESEERKKRAKHEEEDFERQAGEITQETDEGALDALFLSGKLSKELLGEWFVVSNIPEIPYQGSPLLSEEALERAVAMAVGEIMARLKSEMANMPSISESLIKKRVEPIVERIVKDFILEEAVKWGLEHAGDENPVSQKEKKLHAEALDLVA